MSVIGAARQVIVPVADVSAALAFYRDSLGLDVRFQDGERWAALSFGDLTLALAGPEEHPAGGEVALGIKVADVDAALEQLEAAGGSIMTPPADGPHERRAVCRDRFGTPLVVYAPLPS